MRFVKGLRSSHIWIGACPFVQGRTLSERCAEPIRNGVAMRTINTDEHCLLAMVCRLMNV